MKKTTYDIPKYAGPAPSRALSQFMHHWFEDSWALTRYEVDLRFLSEFSDDEREYACDLLRRNLRLGYTHIVEGVAQLRDTSAIPVLRQMLGEEANLSRRLIIAGTLWRLTRDEIFVDSLEQMKASKSATLRQAHIGQVLWLGDHRALDMLIDLLDDSDSFVRHLALSWLNQIEFQAQLLASFAYLPRQANDYRARRNDGTFRKMMVKNLTSLLERIFVNR